MAQAEKDNSVIFAGSIVWPNHEHPSAIGNVTASRDSRNLHRHLQPTVGEMFFSLCGCTSALPHLGGSISSSGSGEMRLLERALELRAPEVAGDVKGTQISVRDSMNGIYADSVMRKRAKKMKRHKWKKRRRILRRKTKVSKGGTA
jgi:hypothetical protein